MTIAGIAPVRPDTRPDIGELGELRLPDGRRLVDMRGGPLAAELNRLGITVAPTLGRHKLAEAYAAHLAGIRERAGRDAVKTWMQQKAKSNV